LKNSGREQIDTSSTSVEKDLLNAFTFSDQPLVLFRMVSSDILPVDVEFVSASDSLSTTLRLSKEAERLIETRMFKEASDSKRPQAIVSLAEYARSYAESISYGVKGEWLTNFYLVSLQDDNPAPNH
jgi:hypothetical protein